VRAGGEEFTTEDAENAEKEKRVNISSLPGFLSGVTGVRVGVGRGRPGPLSRAAPELGLGG
jgi:hypothetical protein